MIDPEAIAGRVVELVGDRAEAEVVVTRERAGLTRFANSFIHQNVAEEAHTVRVRLATEGRVASRASTMVSIDALRALVDATLETAALQSPDEAWPGLHEPAPVSDVHNYDPGTEAATPADRAAMVGDFVAAGAGMRAAGYCETTGAAVAFANTAGHVASGRMSSATVDGIHQTDRSAGSGHGAAVSLGSLDAAAIGKLAARRATDGAAPIDVEPGEYEVVLAPEAVASIGIFLAFYGFNGKAFNEGRSFVEIGERQFDDAVHITDDGTDPRAVGVPFDGEGTPKRAATLVEGGVTRSVTHDRRSAAVAGTRSTGHGYAGSDVNGAFPQNMFMSGGDSTVEELIADVDRGLYVATFNYCRVLDPKTLVVTGLTRNGTFMIESGSITHAVTNLRFTQSFITALGPGEVLGLGDDARLADSEFGPKLVHAPSMRLAGWSFTGGATG